MASPDRMSASPVELFEALRREPYACHFFQALRRLECHYRDQPRFGKAARARDDPVRLTQEPSMAFAPATLAAFDPGAEDRPPRLAQYFLGLFGPQGPLPLHLTEYAYLFGKLNPLAYKAIESATVFCKLRGNPYVELVHWIQQILQQQNSDLHLIVRAFKIDASPICQRHHLALDRLPRGATSISDLSPHIEQGVERAWVWATLKYGEGQVRTGHVILAILKEPAVAERAHVDLQGVRAKSARITLAG
jgi:hypothetical protein